VTVNVDEATTYQRFEGGGASFTDTAARPMNSSGALSPATREDTMRRHDLVDVLPLTKRAKQLNPAMKIMASPWSAPAWMKDDNNMDQGWLRAQYHGAYGQHFGLQYPLLGTKARVNHLTPVCCMTVTAFGGLPQPL
jgi:glucosylceramidase